MSQMPLILVAAMFDEKQKLMGGFDVWTVSTTEHYYSAKDIDELDRNLVFMQFTAIRIKGQMIFVLSAGDSQVSVLQNLKSTRRKIPVLQFQLGHYPNRRAQVEDKPYYILDKFTFMDVEISRIWPSVKQYATEEERSTLVEVKFADSDVQDFEDEKKRIR
ncbi:MAG TPA: hypothetical protein VKF40_08155 [Burkholderiales bacterium]|nr:hypothetical protein [Burkholderiales bacterium]